MKNLLQLIDSNKTINLIIAVVAIHSAIVQKPHLKNGLVKILKHAGTQQNTR